MDKFLGVGITGALGLAIFTMVFIVMAKVVTIKYQSPITEFVQSI